MNKKKRLLFGSSIMVFATSLGVTLAIASPMNDLSQLHADGVSYNLLIDASNTVNTADTAGATAAGTIKTTSGYDVSISAGDFRANNGQAGVFRNSSGYICSTTPVRGIKSLGVCANAPVIAEAGYKVDDIIYWEFSETLNVLDFAGNKCRVYTLPASDYPLNYFRFKATGFSQVKKFEITYSCGDEDKEFNIENRLDKNADYADDPNKLMIISKKDNDSKLGSGTQSADDTFKWTCKVNVQGRSDFTYELALPKRNFSKPFEGFRFQTNYSNVSLKIDGNTVLTTTSSTINTHWFTIMVSSAKKLYVDGKYIYTLTQNEGDGTDRISLTVVTNASAIYAEARFTRLFAYSEVK